MGLLSGTARLVRLLGLESVMRERLMYVEAMASGFAGEAWIGFVAFSKTGATLYFNGRALRSRGHLGHYVDVASGEAFWVSGVKKRGSNRHALGSGPIHVDRRAVAALLQLWGCERLEPSRFVVGDALDVARVRASIHELENRVRDACTDFSAPR